MATSDMAVEAARRCLANRGIMASEVEVIIVATVTPDMLFPNRLPGPGQTLQLATSIDDEEEPGRTTSMNTMSSIIDYTDRTTCVIFGDGAGAVLVEPAGEGEIGLIDFCHEIDGSGACALNMPAGGSLRPASPETIAARMHYVHQDGQAVYKYAVRKMVETTSKLLQSNNISAADLGCFIPHQANKRIILSTAERLGLPLERVVINIDRYGSATAATIPLAMRTARTRGTLPKAREPGAAGIGRRRIHRRCLPPPLGDVTLGICQERSSNRAGSLFLAKRGGLWLRRTSILTPKFPEPVQNGRHHKAQIRPHKDGAPTGEVMTEGAHHCPAISEGKPGHQRITKSSGQAEGNKELPS